MADERENDELKSQAADAAAAREAAAAAEQRGGKTEADEQVERDQRLDEARGKVADAAKAKAKAEAKGKVEARTARVPLEQPKAGAKAEGEADAGDEPDDAPLYETPSAEDRQWAVDSYGAQVATAMDKAGINPAAANGYWQEHGKLPESAFEKLEEAGYPRAMVTTYLDGVKATTDKAADQGRALAAEVTRVAGGKAAYERMTAWASTGGMTAAEMQDFNATIDSRNPGALRLAVGALRARFEQANGKLPRVNLSGQRSARDEGPADEAADADGDVFKSTAEIVAAQRDARYGIDPAYTKEVGQKVTRSNLFGKARRPAAR